MMVGRIMGTNGQTITAIPNPHSLMILPKMILPPHKFSAETDGYRRTLNTYSDLSLGPRAPYPHSPAGAKDRGN